MRSIVACVLQLALAAALFAGLPASRAEAAPVPNKARVFVLTSTYGVMAGTLTGLASLAFYSSPGGHLRNVAQGASLGLYCGILLGAYLVYLQPDPNAVAAPPPPPAAKEEEEGSLNPGERLSEFAQLSAPAALPRLLPVAQIAWSADGRTQTPTFGLSYQF